MQTFTSYIALLTPGVVPELVQHVPGQVRESLIFFIRASPGEVVVGGVVAEAEAAGRVGFNYTCSRRHIHEEADRNQHSENTEPSAPYCVCEVCILLSAGCRC